MSVLDEWRTLSYGDDWRAAFRALVQNDDGKPLADLFRSQGQSMPSAAAYAMAELLDPRFSWSPFVKLSPLLPDQKQTFDDLKVKVRDAWEALKVECTRLAKIYNKQKKPDERLKWWDLIELEAFAEKCQDQDALRGFADHRKARDQLTAAMNSINRAVRLTVKQLSEEHRARLARNDQIVGEMLVELERGRSSNTATQNIGERFGLTDRSVKKIWAAAREATPFLDFGKPPVK